MRNFAVGTKILGGGAGQHLGGPVPPLPQRRTAPARVSAEERKVRHSDIVPNIKGLLKGYLLLMFRVMIKM